MRCLVRALPAVVLCGRSLHSPLLPAHLLLLLLYAAHHLLQYKPCLVCSLLLLAAAAATLDAVSADQGTSIDWWSDN